MSKINTIHNEIISLITEDVTGINTTYTEKPKEMDEEKLPALVVYFDSFDDVFSTNISNNRTYNFVVDIVYDKENLDTSRTVTTDLLYDIIEVLEKRSNLSLSGNVNYTKPIKCKRVEDYFVGGKHYLAYSISFNLISNETIN